MKRICPFREMECTERCKLNTLGRCVFESLSGIEDSLMFEPQKVRKSTRAKKRTKQDK